MITVIVLVSVLGTVVKLMVVLARNIEKEDELIDETHKKI